MLHSESMDIIPKDPTLKQFVDDEQYQQMSDTFQELADSGKSLTRLPRRDFSRRRVLEAIDEAFQLIGGVPRLAHWGHHNPTEFYKLWGKTIPAASQMEVMGQLQHIIRPALPRSPLDGDDDATTESRRESAPLYQPIHGKQRGAEVIQEAKAAGGGGI